MIAMSKSTEHFQIVVTFLNKNYSTSRAHSFFILVLISNNIVFFPLTLALYVKNTKIFIHVSPAAAAAAFVL